jgi:ketosteroid isomerase-like protein
MITRIARAQYEKGLRALERGDLDALFTQFDERCTLTFVGDTPLGAHLSTRADLRRWFERFMRLLPERRFEIQRLVVSGPPWNMRLASHVLIHGRINGEPYTNQFAHFLTLRWGKVVDDLILEDTQMWARACERLAASGIAEAAEGPLAAAVARQHART